MRRNRAGRSNYAFLWFRNHRRTSRLVQSRANIETSTAGNRRRTHIINISIQILLMVGQLKAENLQTRCAFQNSSETNTHIVRTSNMWTAM